MALLLAALAAGMAVFCASLEGQLQDTLLTNDASGLLAVEWTLDTPSGSVVTSEPSRLLAENTDGELILTGRLPDALTGDAAITFQTKNESVHVYIDGERVYSYGDVPQTVFGFGVGAVWHIADIPDDSEGSGIRISMEPTGGRTGLSPYTLLIGSRGEVMSYFRSKLELPALISFMLLIIGIFGAAIAIYAACVGRQWAGAAMYFSIFVVIAAIWMATDSGLFQLLIGNKGVIYMLFGCSFYLFCPPFTMFVSELLPEKRSLFRAMSVITSIYALVRIVLFMMGVVDFEYMLWLLHLMMGILIAMVNAALWIPLFRGQKHEMIELYVATSVLTLMDTVSLVRFYAGSSLDMLRNGYSMDFSISIFAFVLIFAFGIIRQAEQLRRKAYRAAFLEKRAYVDELTEMMNVKGFDDRCAEILAKQSPGRVLAIVDFDVNFFSQFNATNGLDEGDRLLKRIAGSLAAFCKAGELAARQEADHFVCLLSGKSFDELMSRIREADSSLRKRLSSELLLLSYGVAEISDRSLPVPELRNQAVVAKRTVKGNYERNIAVYDRELHDEQLREMGILADFENALASRGYIIYLQPKIRLSDETLVGAEALVRKLEKDGSVTSAGRIIGILESRGFVAKLDYHVFRLTCEFIRRCIDEGLEPPVISVNFSRVHLFDPEFPNLIRSIADSLGVPSGLLEVELAESVFLGGKTSLARAVDRLHELGFSVSIDDFGSGYSSLNMLKDVDADTVKLDAEFFSRAERSERSTTVIRHTLSLAGELGISTVAEGIETREQLEGLREYGCDMAVQGFWFSKPIPEDEFVEKYLERRP